MTSAAATLIPLVRVFPAVIRAAAMTAQILVTLALLGVAAAPASQLLLTISQSYGPMAAAIALPFAYAIWGLMFCGIVVLAKKTIFPITPTGSVPFHSATVARWGFVTLLAKVANQMFVVWTLGTDFAAIWFRLLGAKIGKRVTISTVFIYDWDVIEIGDDSFIAGRSCVMAHIGQNRRVSFARTTIGARCTVGQGTTVFAGVVMEDGVVIGANSVAMRNQRFTRGRTYLGVPAKLVEAERAEPRTQTGITDTIIRLDRNEPQFPPSPECQSVLSGGASLATSYPAGERLRATVAEWIGADEENIIISAGGEGMLRSAFHSLLRTGETVVLPAPSWPYYATLAETARVRVRTFNLIDHGNRFSIDAHAVVTACRDSHASVLLLASPCNPTGMSIEQATLMSILGQIPDVPVVIDEAYWGYRNRTNCHVAQILAAHERVLIVRSFSKFFGLPGLRIGFGVASSGFAGLKKDSALYLGHNALATNAAAAALGSFDYYSGIADTINAQKQHFIDAAAYVPGVSCYESDANFVLCRMSPSQMAQFRSRMEARGVKLKYFDESPLENAVRISIGTPDQNSVVLSEIHALAKAVA